MSMIHAALTDPDYGFDIIDEGGHTMRLDIPVDQGGGGTGFRPMQTVLAALCGCSGVDIVSILKKQKQQMKGLEIAVDGEREKGGDLSLWSSVRLLVSITGEVEPGKAFRAVSLSIDKYCSVAETLRRAGATISWTLTVNGEPAGSSD